MDTVAKQKQIERIQKQATYALKKTKFDAAIFPELVARPFAGNRADRQLCIELPEEDQYLLEVYEGGARISRKESNDEEEVVYAIVLEAVEAFAFQQVCALPDVSVQPTRADEGKIKSIMKEAFYAIDSIFEIWYLDGKRNF